ncbi:hypothetical protein H8959_020301 [Pygathrix nigripes]
MESSDNPETTTFFYYDLQSQLCENQAWAFATLATTILYCLVFLLSLVGNSLVLWVLVKYESLESLTNIFILNLCLSDLVFACLLPVWISPYHWGWVLGDFLCKLLNMIFSISLYSSIFFLTIMTIHRYLSVLSSGCDYSELTWYLTSVYQHNLFFLLSLGIILFCYVEILRTLFRSRSKRRHRTVKLIFAIVVAYFLSWGPYNFTLFLQTLFRTQIIRSCEAKHQLEYALLICRNLAFSHCCFNPVLYVFVGVKFRTHLKHVLRQFWFCRLQAPSPAPIPHSPGAFACEGASFY